MSACSRGRSRRQPSGVRRGAVRRRICSWCCDATRRSKRPGECRWRIRTPWCSVEPIGTSCRATVDPSGSVSRIQGCPAHTRCCSACWASGSWKTPGRRTARCSTAAGSIALRCTTARCWSSARRSRFSVRRCRKTLPVCSTARRSTQHRSRCGRFHRRSTSNTSASRSSPAQPFPSCCAARPGLGKKSSRAPSMRRPRVRARSSR